MYVYAFVYIGQHTNYYYYRVQSIEYSSIAIIYKVRFRKIRKRLKMVHIPPKEGFIVLTTLTDIKINAAVCPRKAQPHYAFTCLSSASNLVSTIIHTSKCCKIFNIIILKIIYIYYYYLYQQFKRLKNVKSERIIIQTSILV